MGAEYYLLDVAGQCALEVPGVLWRLADPALEARGAYRTRAFLPAGLHVVEEANSLADPVKRAVLNFWAWRLGPLVVVWMEGDEEVPWRFPFGETPDPQQPWMNRPEWTILPRPGTAKGPTP